MPPLTLPRLLALPSSVRTLLLKRAVVDVAPSSASLYPTRRCYASAAAHAPPAQPQSSVNDTEVSHFNALASEWWDPHGSSRLLHLMNPLRHDFIRKCLAQEARDPQEKFQYLDVGCGGGIFAESAARLATTQSVTAIDPTPEVIAIANRHRRQDPLLLEPGRLTYLNTAVEGLPSDQQFDIISVFEVIEHIQRPSPFLQSCLAHLKPGGWLIGSTIARTNMSWFTTKFVAEDILRMVPRGTHDWNQYLQPQEIRDWVRAQPELSTDALSWKVMGVVYVPGIGWREVNGSETWGNYFFGMRKRDDAKIRPQLQPLDQYHDGREAQHEDLNITLLARGGHNTLWLVKCSRALKFPFEQPQKSEVSFVLRVANDIALKPDQIRNEVGWLKYMTKHCPEIPVPFVYEFFDGQDGNETPFRAEQYVEASPLTDTWKTYTDLEKAEVAHKIAEIIVRLGETRFDVIGGMTPNGSPGPTVEGVKLFKGCDAFHDSRCYDIGPYATVKQYILAYYNKEIYYYSHADPSVIDLDLFEHTTVSDFVKQLKADLEGARAELTQDRQHEPFVLCHNDFQGRNILMNGTRVAAVVDWEFAGSFPLSELQDNGVDVIEMVDGESVDECHAWARKTSELVEQVAKDRGWGATEIELLKGRPNRVLHVARSEMVPPQPSDATDGPQTPLAEARRRL